MVFDGEYAEEGGFEETLSTYRKGEGYGTLWLFDAVPLHEWMLAEFTATWRQRHAQLMLNHKAINSPWVGALASFAVEEPGDVEPLFRQVREAGHEGLVLKRVD